MEVWCDGQRVGKLNVARPPGGILELVMPIELDDGIVDAWDLDTPIATERLRLVLKQRRVMVTEEEISALGNANVLMRHEIPSDVRCHVDHARHSRVFTWDVIETNVATCERLFDLDSFTPADTEPDYDYLISPSRNINFFTGHAVLTPAPAVRFTSLV